MNKPTEELRKLMAVTYTEGLNVYALVNKIQNDTHYSIPPEVVERICREYLKYKSRIKSPWAWSERVFRLIRDGAFVNSKAGEEKEVRKTNSELIEKLFGGTKLGKDCQ